MEGDQTRGDRPIDVLEPSGGRVCIVLQELAISGAVVIRGVRQVQEGETKL